MTILAVYIRVNSSAKENLEPRAHTPVDIQKILDAFNGPKYTGNSRGRKKINLRRTDLRHAHLKESVLEGITFRDSNLEGAHLRNE
jgi:hypothetical protein